MADSNEQAPDRGKEDSWSWRVAAAEENAGLGLLYEPGNWGDILKGTWARIVTSLLPLEASQQRVTCIDPWCGAPDYPLLETTARRLDELGSCRFIDSQRDWLEKGRLASTGSLIRQGLLERELQVDLRVFDSDPDRLDRWSAVPGAKALSISSGEEALKESEAELVLVDPYDFLASWEETLPLLGELAKSSTVLVYIYNRAPRGGQHTRDYNRFRDQLEQLGSSYAAGRIGSDIVLPRAFHEMILLAPPGVTGLLEDELARATRQLACKMSTAGCFERGGP